MLEAKLAWLVRVCAAMIGVYVCGWVGGWVGGYVYVCAWVRMCGCARVCV